MVSRREILQAGGLCFVGGTSCFAGCLGSSSDGDDESEQEDDEDAQEEYDAALNLLKKNADDLDEFAESEETPNSFDEATIDSRADKVDEKLDAAEKSVAEDQQAKIENARNVAAYQREMANYNSHLVEFNNCFDTVDSYINSDRWEDANDHFNECTSALNDTQGQLQTVKSAHDDIDPDLLGDEDQIDYQSIDESLQTEESDLEFLSEFLRGLDQFLDGIPQMLSALEMFDNEEFTQAESEFAGAKTTFYASEDTFERLENDSDTPSRFSSDVIELRCQTSAMAEASEHFEASSAAAANENWNEADTRYTQGEEALNQCE